MNQHKRKKKTTKQQKHVCVNKNNQGTEKIQQKLKHGQPISALFPLCCEVKAKMLLGHDGTGDKTKTDFTSVTTICR